MALKEWLIVALAYLGAHKFGLWSLLFIPFPLQVLVKSCKTIPGTRQSYYARGACAPVRMIWHCNSHCVRAAAVVVMLGEIVLAGARPSASKIMSVVVLTVGIGVFMLFKPSKKAGSGDTFEWNLDMAKGCFLVLLALVMDGVYGPYQNKITKEAEKANKGEKLSPYHLMFNMNFYQGVFSLIMVSLECPPAITLSFFPV